MNRLRNFGCLRGVLMGGTLWALLVVTALAEEIPSSAQSVQFEDFELVLPEGLDRNDFFVPEDNPINRDKVELGRALFFDTRLSFDNTISCATCHSPQAAFADALRTSVGIDAQEGERNAPTIINRAFSREQFWDGRASSLEEQSKGPLINPKEMGMPSHEAVVKKVRTIKGYKRWFKRVFQRDVDIDGLAKAIAAFERTIVSGSSKFDEYMEGNQRALSKSGKRGLALFEGKARCTQCHAGSNFTDEKYHNLGIDWDTSMVDLGRYKATGRQQDIGAFKTPTLREIADTAPYMHHGAFATLEETVEFYNRGGIANPFLDIEMRRSNRTLEQILDFYEKEKQPQVKKSRGRQSELVRLNLTKQEQADIVAFLKALSGKGWRHILPPDSFPE
jgi:cytochrome c peroxidase